MSQTHRYMSRTAGRVERRGAPAPYTPTKPAPTTPEKKSSSIWDYIKSWSFFASSKNTASEVPEPTPEPSSPANPPPSLRDIITRHNRTASPNLRETQEAIVAMQAKATKNLYERGLELQREHEQLLQEIVPPPSTSPSEPAEEEKPKVYHMPFYHRPGTKEWFIANITNHPGKSPNEVVANYLMSKATSTEPLNPIETSAIHDVLLDLKPQKKAAPPPAPRTRVQPKEPEIPVFIDEWITKPKWEYCLPGDDIWDGKVYTSRPRDIPEGMEYRSLSGGRGYLGKKRPGGFWNTGRPPQPTASASKRPQLADGGLSASTSALMSLSLPPKTTDPELFIPHVPSKPPPPPPLISTGGPKPLAERQKNEAPKKDAVLKKSLTYKTMQEIVIEETAKKAAEEKERQRKELIERAMAALDGGAGRPPIRRDRPILRYPDPQDPGKYPTFKKRQPKKEQPKKVPTVNDILDIHTGRADPLHFDVPAVTSDPVPRPPAMKPYDPTPRKSSPKRSLDEHQQEHGEDETVGTSPKKRVKTNGAMLATYVQATSGSGAAAEDAIVIDDLDEEMNDAKASASAITFPTPASAPAPAPAQATLVPPPPSKSRAISTLPPMNPLAPPYVRAFSPSRPSPLRMVSSVDSPEGSPHPTSSSIFNAKPKLEQDVIDVDAEEDQLAGDDNDKTPTPVSTSITVTSPLSAPVFKPTPAPAPVAQLKPQQFISSWTFPMPKVPQPKVPQPKVPQPKVPQPEVTQPVPPVSPKTAARNAPADSLRDYSKDLPGTPLCYDVIMGNPEAQTIAHVASQDELPAFEIDLSPMFNPTPWIERKNIALPARGALTSAQAPKPGAPITSAVATHPPALKPNSVPPAAPASVTPIAFNWAAAGLKPSTPVAGEWTCTLCNCKTKDTLSKCSVCEAPKPGAAASAPTLAPTSPSMPALIPDSAPVKAAPVGFNWAAAGLKLPTKAVGTWTCSVCTIDNKPENDKCIVCEAPKSGPVPVSTPLTDGFKLPPPIRNNGLTWSIPPPSIFASEPAIKGT